MCSITWKTFRTPSGSTAPWATSHLWNLKTSSLNDSNKSAKSPIRAFEERSTVIGADKSFNGVLPGAGLHAVVRTGQIRLGDLEIQHRLARGIVLGFDDLARLVFVRGAQAGAFASRGVHAIYRQPRMPRQIKRQRVFIIFSRNREDKMN